MNIPVTLAVVSLVCAGLATFFNKVAASEGVYFPPFLMIVNVSYLIMAMVIHVTQKQAFEVTPRMIWIGLLVGMVGSIGYACMFFALQKGGAGSVVFPIVSLGVIVSVPLSIIVFREPVTATKLLGLVFGVTSIIFLSR